MIRSGIDTVELQPGFDVAGQHRMVLIVLIISMVLSVAGILA